MGLVTGRAGHCGMANVLCLSISRPVHCRPLPTHRPDVATHLAISGQQLCCLQSGQPSYVSLPSLTLPEFGAIEVTPGLRIALHEDLAKRKCECREAC